MSTDLNLLDPKHLVFLDLLYRSRSVTRAAEQMGLSQPTVSVWLSQLRASLGDPLFVRTTDGMQATPRVEAMLDTLRGVLEGLRRLSEPATAFEPARSKREFRIFMTDASHITLLPRLFTHVHAQAPGVRLEAAPIRPGLLQAMENGEADLALGLLPDLESGFFQQALFEQDWVCLANARHPRIQGRLSRAAYAREAHAGVVAGTGQVLLEEALKRTRVEREVKLKVPGFLGLSTILATTDLIGTLPRQIGETLAQNSGLQVLACPIAIPRFTVKQHWHARFHHDPANRWLRGVCAALFMAASTQALAPSSPARPRSSVPTRSRPPSNR